MSEDKVSGRRKWLLALAVAGAAVTWGRARAAGVETVRQPREAGDEAFIERAFALRREALQNGDQGFGALVVQDGRIVGQAPSRVVVNRDPTAHAEMEAIRDAARRLGRGDLGGAVMYSSSPPCPMCEAAAYWAGIGRLVYGSAARDGGQPRLCG